jgi:acetylornithine/succinyldiaminopimelate/putrescine aminotransferase
VYNLGHRHPRLVAALRDGFEILEIGNAHMLTQYKAWAAEKLAASTGGQLPGVAYTSSGTEAVEVTMKTARGVTRRRKIVSLEDSYHGHSIMTIAAAGNGAHRKRYLADYPDEFVRVPWNDYGAMEKAVDDDTAGVLLEPMPARLGFPPPKPGYLEKVQKLCRDRGALLMMDEVITGVGGTGTFWLYQQENIVPDVLATAKGIGGGLQANAAALLKPEHYKWLCDDYMGHYTTFGGNELGCVATAVTCDIIMEPGFLEHVRALAKRFAEGFQDAPFELSHRGLCMGLMLPEPRNGDMVRALYENGVLAAGGRPNVVQLRAPLILSLDEADEIIFFNDTATTEIYT